MTASQKSAYAAFAWSVVFAVPHVYWAAGGTGGLDGDPVVGALAMINYAAVVLSVIAAGLALALVRAWGAALSRRVLLSAAWGACVLLSLRGTAGLLQDLVVALGGSENHVPALVVVFEALFLVGGMLFGLAAHHAAADQRRSESTSPSAPS